MLDNKFSAQSGWSLWHATTFCLMTVVPAIFLLSLTGCDSKPEVAEIVGTVSFGGKPVYPAVVLLKGDSGRSYTAKLTQEGGFRVFGVEKDNYRVAIETIKLGTKPEPASDAAPKSMDDSGFPTRELTAPAQYQNANVNIPKKYNSFDTSGLVVDCSEHYPTAPLDFQLEK